MQDKPPYSALAIANWFLTHGRKPRESLSPLKLQKLVYFAHGWHLAIFGEPLIDEPVEAWQYGPVIASVYHEFKRFGGGDIRALGRELRISDESPDADPNAVTFYPCEPEIPKSDMRRHDLLRRIWTVYGGFSAIDLSRITHARGTPWQQTWEAPPRQLRGKDISNELIDRYFREQAKRSK